MTDHTLHGNHDPCPACEMRRQAETAMGSSKRILEDWQIQRAHGWHHYWTPDRCVSLAARHPAVRGMVWC